MRRHSQIRPRRSVQQSGTSRSPMPRNKFDNISFCGPDIDGCLCAISNVQLPSDLPRSSPRAGSSSWRVKFGPGVQLSDRRALRQNPVGVPSASRQVSASSSFKRRDRDRGPPLSLSKLRAKRSDPLRQPQSREPRPDHAQRLLWFFRRKLLDCFGFSFMKIGGWPSLRTYQPPRQHSDSFVMLRFSGFLRLSCKVRNGQEGTAGQLGGLGHQPPTPRSSGRLSPVKGPVSS